MKFTPVGNGRGITNYESNCIMNQKMAQTLGAQNGQQYRSVLMHDTSSIMSEQKRKNAKNHENACVACPLCNNQYGTQKPGFLATLANMLFG